MMAVAAIAVIGALVLGLALGFALADGGRAQLKAELAIAEDAAISWHARSETWRRRYFATAEGQEELARTAGGAG